MSVYTIQPSFTGGEFSPSLYSRVDVQKYSTGLKKLKNMIVHPHGGASNRPGLEFIAESSNPDTYTKLIPFEYSLTQAYVVEFSNYTIRVIKDGGLVLYSPGVVYVDASPYSAADLVDLKFTQSVDVIYLFHPLIRPKTLTRLADNSWVFANFEFTKGPFISAQETVNTMSVTPTSPDPYPTLGLALSGYLGSATTSTAFFESGHLESLIKVNFFCQSTAISSTLSGTGVSSEIIAKGTWRLSTRGTWTGTVTVRRNTPGSYSTWEVIKTFSHNAADYNIDAFGEEDELCRMSVEMTSYTSGTCYIDLSCDSFTHNGVIKVKLISSPTVALIEVVESVPMYATPLSWQEGSWSDKRGFPTCGAFYQDRLVLAATTGEPQTTWFSKTGNYVDFGTTSPLEDTDAISVNLPSRKMNGINNLLALSEVLAMTSGSECSIGETGGVFSPTTVKTKVHGYRGSSGVDPVVVGNRAIMVQAMGGAVRDFAYDFSSDGFTGSDLSIFSTHLFKGFTITEMAYQQEPDSIVWALRSDGKFLSMTYMKEQDVVAWAQHETDGVIESICSIPGDGQNDVYMVVNRGNVRYVERLSKRLPIADGAEAFFLDSALTYRGVATTTISGLTHLNGRTVNALCDGRVVLGLVVTAGVITIPVAAEIVTVGLPYVSDFQTLNIQVPMQDGSGYGRLVKVAEVGFTFLNSRGGYIGPDEDNLDEIIPVTAAILSDPQALFTGEYKQTMASGYEPGGSIFYRQTDPLPVTILSVMPKVTVGG